MISVEPKDLSVPQAHQYLLSGIAPRPIALVSTISNEGVNNLSPFSFFNAFGANPPTVAFSPARRGTDNTTKDTYSNLVANGECVIHSVSYSMVEQINLASCEYDSNVDEFIKAGFTAIDSDLVKPKRVKEAPIHFECKLIQMVELGGKAGSGNLAICEVIKFHISEDILIEGKIHPDLIDLVGRNGFEYYTRASGNSIFELKKPGKIKGIGFDKLPEEILSSHLLSANNLGQLALVDSIPSDESVFEFYSSIEIIEATKQRYEIAKRIEDYEEMLKCSLSFAKIGEYNSKYFFEETAKAALGFVEVEFAWKTILIALNILKIY